MQISNSTITWPIFTECDQCSKFWRNSDRTPTADILISLKLQKMGKRKQTERYVTLYSHGLLGYEKKNTSFNYMALSMAMSVKMIELKLKEQDAVRVIRLKRNQKVFLYLWNADHQLLNSLRSWLPFVYARISSKGGFSKVYHLTPVNKQPYQLPFYAGKVYNKNELTQKKEINYISQLVKTECEILKKVNSPFILTLFEVIQLDEVLILITELLKGGSLYQLLRERSRVQEGEASGIVFRIALGLQALHNLGYVHRDIKLENVLMDKDVIKIIDFGFAERINREELTLGQGTVGYMAPEIFAGTPYTESGDVFSLGVIYYALLTGKAPFRCNNQEALLRANKSADIDYSEYRFVNVSQKIIWLIKGMLQRNPKQRTTLNEIIQQLKNQSLQLNAVYTSVSVDGSQISGKKGGVQSLFQGSQFSSCSIKKKQLLAPLVENKFIVKASSFKRSLVYIDNMSSNDDDTLEDLLLPQFVIQFLSLSMETMNHKKFGE